MEIIPLLFKDAVARSGARFALIEPLDGKDFTIWPEQDFLRTHTLKVNRQEILTALPEIRQQKKEG